MPSDYYCECGQYLNTYFEIVGKVSVNGPATFSGLPCPAKGCTKTYRMEKTANESATEIGPRILVDVAQCTVLRDNTADGPEMVQTMNPRTGMYIKIDRATGRVVAHKKSPGPYKGIPVVEGA